MRSILESLILLHATNKDTDQTAQSRSMVSAFVIRSLENTMA